jgi:hypothetical protein
MHDTQVGMENKLQDNEWLSADESNGEKLAS